MKEQKPVLSQMSQTRNSEVLRTFNKFFKGEATGGIILLVCTLIAVTFATIPGCGWFDNFWETEANFKIGSFGMDMSLREWVNDALMAVFFFTVGLEIKREMLVGQLSSFKRSILPILAALGGMAVPALFFTIFNHGEISSSGWGIPTATDIAFAIGILSILGDRVPLGLKVFLTALAIVDDLGAIVILAIFYPTHTLYLGNLLIVAAIMALLFVFKKLKIQKGAFYIIPGIFMWYFTWKSGIHATISGVLLAMMIPSKGVINEVKFLSRVGLSLDKFKVTSNGKTEVLGSPEQQHIIHDLHNAVAKIDPLMHRFESRLQPWVTFFIMPIFALANAGVSLSGGLFTNGISPVTLGIFFGLVFGKPIGIFSVSFLAIKAGIAEKPAGINWIQLFSVAILGGIGFTMSIFVTGLAFTDQNLVNIGKVSILLSSATAAVLGLIAVALTCRGKAPVPTSGEILPEKPQSVEQ